MVGEAVGFVVPDLGRPSGGTAYDEAVVRAWPAHLPVPVVHRVPVNDTAAGELAEALAAQRVCIVDGLLGSEHPDLLAAARSRGHRVVLLVHLPRPADGHPDEEAGRLAALEAQAIAEAAATVVPSRWAAQDLAARYGRTAVVAVPGTDPAPVADTHDPPVVLQLGAIGPLKNQLLLAHAALACRGLRFRLRFVGPVVDPAYAAELTSALAPLGDTASVEGALTGQARDELLAAADLVVSVAHRETYGMTVTEGLARGIPAVVGRGTGAEEALTAGGTAPGRAVATDGPAELSAALRGVLTDPVLRAQWRTSALHARDRLPGWEETARAIARVCASVQDELGAEVGAQGEPA